MSRSRHDLAAVVDALDTLTREGPGLVDPQHLDAAAALQGRIATRVGHGDELTVVAVAGGTGVGKSALVNRLAGAQVATEGVRRPTTAHPVAVAADLDDPVRVLLDELRIDDRRTVDGRLPSGLILVDLPDHDSVVLSHRETSDRLAGRVDAVVVVVDPLKYARADLHDGPLAALTRHAEVVTVVLNRSDELSAKDLDRCRADLISRLEADGLGDAPVLTTSAATGDGVRELHEHLARLAGTRRAAVARLVADAAQLADQVVGDIADPPELSVAVDALLEPLVRATDAGRTAADAASAYRIGAAAGCRSPLARLVRLPGRLAAPFQLVFQPPLPTSRPPSRSVAAIEAVLARSLDLGATTGSSHAALARTVQAVAHDAAPQVIDAIDAVPRRPAHRGWWKAMAWLRGVAEVVTVAGVVWLVLLGVSGWLGLPDLPRPDATDELSWPAALFLGGLILRVVLGVLSRGLIAAGARRHARRVAREVRRQLTTALRTHVVDPVAGEVSRRRHLRDHLEVLRRSQDVRRN